MGGFMSFKHFAAFLPVIAAAACQAKPEPQPGAPPPAATAAPANVSHGEAPVGTGEHAPFDAAPPARSTTRTHHIRLVISHNKVMIAPDVAYDAWTFGGKVPGPIIRVTVGDTVDFTLVNSSPMPHSMDFHAAEVAPSRAYVNVMPNDSLHYQWVAHVAGAFMYHCGTAPVAMHIANGMYGALIVDPVRPRAAAREFVLVQSEFYTRSGDSPDSALSLDWDKLLGQAPEYVVFNGRAAQYADNPLRVWTGEPLRFYVVDAGPNRVSSFHVVGAIFSRVYVDGSDRPLEGVQTVNVPVGGGIIFETHLAESGTYVFVTHAFADATKGAVGMLEAVNREGH
jgi:nitrite reductase (NO-forming)